MKIDIKRSNRRSIAIEITKDARVLVRAPRWAPLSEIEYFVREKSDWIDKQLKEARIKQAERSQKEPFTKEQLEALADQALEVLTSRVAYYAKLLGVTYGRITIRNQKTRWGSCSSKGNLNFNCLLMLTPKEVQDYVVVHELCHRKEMNHSERFWQKVEEVMPDYAQWRKWLKENGGELIERML